MTITRVVWLTNDGQQVTLLRDARVVGDFLQGVECNEHGIGTRQGCSEEAEFMIHVSRIREQGVISDGGI